MRGIVTVGVLGLTAHGALEAGWGEGRGGGGARRE